MNTPVGLDKCLSFINCQLQPPGKRPLIRGRPHRPVVTISRQTGSGGHAVAESLAQYLQAHTPHESGPWAVFDRDLVEKVLVDHHLPKRLARFMAEDRISGIADTLDELFGLHPPSWALVRQVADTILHLAELGNVIIIGRGANAITRKLDAAYHVRLVGSIEKRIEHIREAQSLSRKAALQFIRKEDAGRRRYLKKYFSEDIDNLLRYHLIINTDLVSYHESARIIGDAVLNRMPQTPESPAPVL